MSATTPLTVGLAKACAYAAVWYLGVYVELGVPTFLALVIFAAATTNHCTPIPPSIFAVGGGSDHQPLRADNAKHATDEQQLRQRHAAAAAAAQARVHGNEGGVSMAS